MLSDDEDDYWSRFQLEQVPLATGRLQDLSEASYQEISWIIAQRLVFDQEQLLHPLCSACQTLRTTFWKFEIEPTFCTQEYHGRHSARFEIHGDLGSEINLLNHTELGYPGYKLENYYSLFKHKELGYSGDKLENCRLLKANKVRPVIDYDLIKSWLKHCQNDHIKCSLVQPSLISKLENVRLLDVWERRLVGYTTEKKFLALSYVWGEAKQPTVAKDSGVPPTLPLTIEHAMMIARGLDYRYLWVDSICIDQSDSAEKSEQIAAMDAVYSCASATLITLDSAHADLAFLVWFPRIMNSTLENSR